MKGLGLNWGQNSTSRGLLLGDCSSDDDDSVLNEYRRPSLYKRTAVAQSPPLFKGGGGAESLSSTTANNNNNEAPTLTTPTYPQRRRHSTDDDDDDDNNNEAAKCDDRQRRRKKGDCNNTDTRMNRDQQKSPRSIPEQQRKCTTTLNHDDSQLQDDDETDNASRRNQNVLKSPKTLVRKSSIVTPKVDHDKSPVKRKSTTTTRSGSCRRPSGSLTSPSSIDDDDEELSEPPIAATTKSPRRSKAVVVVKKTNRGEDDDVVARSPCRKPSGSLTSRRSVQEEEEILAATTMSPRSKAKEKKKNLLDGCDDGVIVLRSPTRSRKPPSSSSLSNGTTQRGEQAVISPKKKRMEVVVSSSSSMLSPTKKSSPKKKNERVSSNVTSRDEIGKPSQSPRKVKSSKSKSPSSSRGTYQMLQTPCLDGMNEDETDLVSDVHVVDDKQVKRSQAKEGTTTTTTTTTIPLSEMMMTPPTQPSSPNRKQRLVVQYVHDDGNSIVTTDDDDASRTVPSMKKIGWATLVVQEGEDDSVLFPSAADSNNTKNTASPRLDNHDDIVQPQQLRRMESFLQRKISLDDLDGENSVFEPHPMIFLNPQLDDNDNVNVKKPMSPSTFPLQKERPTGSRDNDVPISPRQPPAVLRDTVDKKRLPQMHDTTATAMDQVSPSRRQALPAPPMSGSLKERMLFWTQLQNSDFQNVVNNKCPRSFPPTQPKSSSSSTIDHNKKQNHTQTVRNRREARSDIGTTAIDSAPTKEPQSPRRTRSGRLVSPRSHRRPRSTVETTTEITTAADGTNPPNKNAITRDDERSAGDIEREMESSPNDNSAKKPPFTQECTSNATEVECSTGLATRDNHHLSSRRGIHNRQTSFKNHTSPKSPSRVHPHTNNVSTMNGGSVMTPLSPRKRLTGATTRIGRRIVLSGGESQRKIIDHDNKDEPEQHKSTVDTISHNSPRQEKRPSGLFETSMPSFAELRRRAMRVAKEIESDDEEDDRDNRPRPKFVGSARKNTLSDGRPPVAARHPETTVEAAKLPELHQNAIQDAANDTEEKSDRVTSTTTSSSSQQILDNKNSAEALIHQSPKQRKSIIQPLIQSFNPLTSIDTTSESVGTTARFLRRFSKRTLKSSEEDDDAVVGETMKDNAGRENNEPQEQRSPVRLGVMSLPAHAVTTPVSSSPRKLPLPCPTTTIPMIQPCVSYHPEQPQPRTLSPKSSPSNERKGPVGLTSYRDQRMDALCRAPPRTLSSNSSSLENMKSVKERMALWKEASSSSKKKQHPTTAATTTSTFPYPSATSRWSRPDKVRNNDNTPNVITIPASGEEDEDATAERSLFAPENGAPHQQRQDDAGFANTETVNDSGSRATPHMLLVREGGGSIDRHSHRSNASSSISDMSYHNEE